jgi:hypothetical protein
MTMNNSERVSDWLHLCSRSQATHGPTSLPSVLLALAVAVGLAACAAADRPDNAAAFAAIHAGESGREVVVTGIVAGVDGELAGASGAHERFTVRVTDGSAMQTILVADNISIGESAPLAVGDDVIVKGVLEIDPSGPVIHWTHHDPEFRHESGFVEVGGKKYD